MYLLKATLLNLLPESVVMLSSANEGKTESSINQLGLNLASEIRQFIAGHLHLRQKQLKKISFIGHSLGGIIIREALKHLG